MSRLRLFLRALLIQAGWNRERMQALGFTYALLPLDGPRGAPAEAEFVRRHLAYVNTNPAMSAVLLGAVAAEEARLEVAGASGEAASERVAGVKRRLEGGLAALGDRAFWGWLRPLLGVVGALVLFWPGTQVGGGSGVGRLLRPDPAAGAADPAWAWASVLVGLAFYNGPYLVTRWRAAERGLRLRHGGDQALAGAARGFGVARIANACEILGPCLLGALAGLIAAQMEWVAAGAAAGSGAGAALILAAVLLGIGAARYRCPAERVGMVVLALLLLASAVS